MKRIIILIVALLVGIANSQEDSGVTTEYAKKLQTLELAFKPLLDKQKERMIFFELIDTDPGVLFTQDQAGKGAAEAAKVVLKRAQMRILGMQYIVASISILKANSEAGTPLSRDQQKELKQCWDGLIDVQVGVSETKELEKGMIFDPETVDPEMLKSTETLLEHSKKTIEEWELLYPKIMAILDEIVQE